MPTKRDQVSACPRPCRRCQYRRRGPEGSAVIDVLGDRPKTRILSANPTDSEHDYDVTDVARLADTGRSAVYRHVDDLLEIGLVERTRKSGNGPIDRIDRDSDADGAFATFEWEVIRALGDAESDSSPESA